MEIGKQRQVCHGFRLNQGSNPHDLLLDDPWDLTHACNEHGKNEALGQGMQEHDYHPCVSNQIASLKGSQWLPKVAPLLLLLLTLSYMPPDENW